MALTWTIALFSILLAILTSSCAAAASPGETSLDSAVLLSDATGFYNLIPYSSVLEDREGGFSIGDVLSQMSGVAGDFTPNHSPSFNRGLNTAFFWLRVVIHNEQAEQGAWRLEVSPSSIDLLEVYLPQADGKVTVWETGDQKPFAQREIAYRTFVFALDVPRGVSQVIYIRFQNKAQSRISLSLWSELGFAAFQTREQFFLGLFYGSLVVVWNYSLLLLLSLRRRVSWHFSLLAVALFSSLLLFVSDGLAYWLIWPSAAQLNDTALLTLWALTGASTFHLVQQFAVVETGKAPLGWLLRACFVIWLFLAGMNMAFDHWAIAWAIQLFTIPSLLLLGFVGMRLPWALSGTRRTVLLIMTLVAIFGLSLPIATLVPGIDLDPITSARLLTLTFLVLTSLVIRGRYDLIVQQQLEAEQAVARAAAENERLILHHSKRLAVQIEELNREFTALLDLTVLVTGERDWEELLAPMLTSMLEVGRLDAVAVHMLSNDLGNLELLAQIGLPEAVLPALENLETPLPPGNPVETSAAVQVTVSKLDEFKQSLCLLLKVHGSPFGLLTAYRKNDAPFSSDQSAVLAAFTTYLSVKIENQRLRLEVEHRAVDLERQRMARDLHDSLNQSIYSLTLLARASRDAQDEGEVERLNENLALLEEYAHLALGEMRLLLYQLRPPELAELGLAGALEARFGLVERRTGLDAKVSAPKGLRLPPEIEIELYRICIEALNNSLKHAHATQVQVSLSTDRDGCLVMCIEDNGIGFDPAAISQGMGMQNMQARAAQIHAHIAVVGRAGGGTQLCVTAPLSKEEN